MPYIRTTKLTKKVKLMMVFARALFYKVEDQFRRIYCFFIIKFIIFMLSLSCLCDIVFMEVVLCLLKFPVKKFI